MEIYADTRTVLASIEQSTSLTQSTVTEQNKALLELVVDLRQGAEKVEQQSVAGGGSDAARDVLERAVRRVEKITRASDLVSTPPSGRTQEGIGSEIGTRGNVEAIAKLTSWPDRDSASEAIRTLAGLSADARRMLVSTAAIELVRRREGRTDLIPSWSERSDKESEAAIQQLVEMGLIREVPEPTYFQRWEVFEGEDERWTSLTTLGRSVARVILAQGDPPVEIPDWLVEMRKQASERVAKTGPSLGVLQSGGTDE
jgi:hypothetical protein